MKQIQCTLSHWRFSNDTKIVLKGTMVWDIGAHIHVNIMII